MGEYYEDNVFDEEDDDLKPCPFCGGEAIVNTRAWYGIRLWSVACNDCMVETDECSDKKLAFNKWNRRVKDIAAKC